MDIEKNAKAVLSALILAGFGRREIGDTLAYAQMMACHEEEIQAIIAGVESETKAKERAAAAPMRCHHVNDGRIKTLIKAVDSIG